MPAWSFTRMVQTGALVLLGGAAGLMGYRFIRADLAAHVYRERLAALAQDYESLRSTYNEAVRRTAVTELNVKDGKLSVRVVNDEGVVREVATPFDPTREVFVDFVVVGQRLWIRRVFDAKTPPTQAVVIDPELKDINWDDPATSYGKAVYRRLEEGRWVVKVSGDGSLSLGKVGPRDEVNLTSAPRMKDYKQAEAEAKAQADAIGMAEVWDWLVGG